MNTLTLLLFFSYITCVALLNCDDPDDVSVPPVTLPCSSTKLPCLKPKLLDPIYVDPLEGIDGDERGNQTAPLRSWQGAESRLTLLSAQEQCFNWLNDHRFCAVSVLFRPGLLTNAPVVPVI